MICIMCVLLFAQLEVVQSNMTQQQTMKHVGEVEPGKDTVISVLLSVPMKKGECSFWLDLCKCESVFIVSG